MMVVSIQVLTVTRPLMIMILPTPTITTSRHCTTTIRHDDSASPGLFHSHPFHHHHPQQQQYWSTRRILQLILLSSSSIQSSQSPVSLCLLS
jgi:hypothetical protein